ncbi:MAG: hypothetical protein WCC90_00270 [Methylocella sp.]
MKVSRSALNSRFGSILLKNSIFAAITIPEAAGGLQEESATGFGRKADFSVCGARSELAMATRGAIRPA